MVTRHPIPRSWILSADIGGGGGGGGGGGNIVMKMGTHQFKALKLYKLMYKFYLKMKHSKDICFKQIQIHLELYQDR